MGGRTGIAAAIRHAGAAGRAGLGRLPDGLLFFRLRALEAGRLTAARYVTPQPPPNAVRLGLVVTHFHRVAQVLPAVERIRCLLRRPDLRGRLTLTVMDNSRNLPLASDAEVTVIPNQNLGGTGGFVRGMLSLIDGGTHTHALFMDDDASCETASTARALALLSYARTPRLAVTGALISESRPWQLLENGARLVRLDEAYRLPRSGGRESKLRRLLRVLTLQGYLLPRSLLSSKVLVHEKSFHGRARDVFGYRRVLYRHVASETGLAPST